MSTEHPTPQPVHPEDQPPLTQMSAPVVVLNSRSLINLSERWQRALHVCVNSVLETQAHPPARVRVRAFDHPNQRNVRFDVYEIPPFADLGSEKPVLTIANTAVFLAEEGADPSINPDLDPKAPPSPQVGEHPKILNLPDKEDAHVLQDAEHVSRNLWNSTPEAGWSSVGFWSGIAANLLLKQQAAIDLALKALAQNDADLARRLLQAVAVPEDHKPNEKAPT